MPSHKVRISDVRQLIRLFGDVRVARTPAEAGRHLVDGLCRLVDADAGWFVDLIRQADGQWSPAGAGAGSEVDVRVRKYMADFGREFPVEADVMGVKILADERPAFVQHWRDAAAAAPPGRLAPFADLVDTLGIADMADPVFSLAPGHRFAINLQRVGSARRPFKPRESALLELVATELRWLHQTGRLTLSTLTRQPEPQPLPPRLQQVFDALLTGRSPKQIAYALGLSLHTVRDHIRRLYRLLKVSGRDELMAKYLRR